MSACSGKFGTIYRNKKVPHKATNLPSGCTVIGMNAAIRRTRIISNQLGCPGNLGGLECEDFDEAGLPVEIGVYPPAMAYFVEHGRVHRVEDRPDLAHRIGHELQG